MPAEPTSAPEQSAASGATRLRLLLGTGAAVLLGACAAFDSRQDFEEHNVLRQVASLRQIPVRLTCGTADPFLPGVRTLLEALPHAQHELGGGGHDLAWWRRAAPGQLAFVGSQLSRLRR